jgi:predicted ester cyclase
MRVRLWVFASGALLGAVLLGTGLEGYAEEQKLDLKKIADKITRTVNSGDPVAITKLYAPGAVMLQSGEQGPVRGHAALLKYYQGMYKSFPDMKVEWSSILFSGDTIVFEGVNRGTFSCPMTTPEGDVGPTGKSFNMRLVFIGEISPDGLIAEDRTYFDNQDFMRQVGLAK